MVEEQKAPLVEKAVIAPELLKLQKSVCRGKSVIGIDVGVSSVNVAQAVMYHGKPTLVKVAVKDIKIDNERGRENATIVALKNVLAGFNTKKADIICVMPSRQTVVENLVLPLMPEEEIRGAVDIEVKTSQYFTIEKPLLDFKVSGRETEDGVEKMNVMVAGAGRASVDNLLAKFMPREGKPLAGASKTDQVEPPVGLRVSALIPLAIALENLIKKSKLQSDETLAIIEMGTISTELNIYHNGQLALSRQIPVTGFDLTRSLTSALFTDVGKLELTMVEAEAIKRQHGIPVPGENYLINGKITAGQVLSLLRPKLEQLTSDIGRAFDYFQDKKQGEKVDRIILFGGGVKLKGLPEFLNAELGVPVDIGDPLQDVELLFDGLLQDKDDAQRLVQAIGASLGDTTGINLLPLHLKERKKRSFERIAIITVLVIALGISLAVYLSLSFHITAARQKTETAKHEYQALFPKLEELKDGLLLKQYVRARPDLGKVLNYFSYLPANIYLTGMDLKGDRVSLSGIVTGEKDPKAFVTQLIGDLKKGILDEARFVSVKNPVRRKDVAEFKIEGRVVAGGGAQ